LNRTIEDTLETFWIANLRGGWQAQVTLNLNHFGFESADYTGYTVGAAPFSVPHDLYHLPGAAFILNTPNRAVSGSMVVGYSAQSIFPEASEGRQVVLTTVAALRPTPALRVEARWVHQRRTRARGGSRFSTANIPRLKLEYQLTRAIFVRYIGQYFSEDQAALLDPRTGQPLLVHDSTARAIVSNDFRNDVLFSYKPPPGPEILIGYGASLTEADAFRFRDLSRPAAWLFLKISYLFRMHIPAISYAVGPTGHLLYVVYLIAPLQAALYLGRNEAWQALVLNLAGFALVTAVRTSQGAPGWSWSESLEETLVLLVTSAALLPMLTRIIARLRATRITVARLEAGDLTVRVPDDAPDDLGFLGVSVNRT